MVQLFLETVNSAVSRLAPLPLQRQGQRKGNSLVMEFDLESSQMDIWKLKKTSKATFSHRDWFVRRYWDWGPTLQLGQELGEESCFSDLPLLALKMYLALSYQSRSISLPIFLSAPTGEVVTFAIKAQA